MMISRWKALERMNDEEDFLLLLVISICMLLSCVRQFLRRRLRVSAMTAPSTIRPVRAY